MSRLTCINCGSTFSLVSNLNHHKSRCKGKNHCNLCDTTFPKQKDLNIHLRSEHGSFMESYVNKLTNRSKGDIDFIDGVDGADSFDNTEADVILAAPSVLSSLIIMVIILFK